LVNNAVSGLAPAKNEGKLSLYPVPVKDRLRVAFDNEKNETLQLNVYSADGTKVITLIVSAVAGHNEYVINTASLQSGLYIFNVSRDGFVFNTKKFAKN
jgi:hypothetical protein